MRSRRMRCCFIKTRDRKLIERIVTYCNRIVGNLSRFNNDYQTFLNDTMLQDACCMCVIQIGDIPALKAACEAMLK